MAASTTAFARTSSTRLLWLAAVALPPAVQFAPELLSTESVDTIGTPLSLLVTVLGVMSLAAIGSGMLINRAGRTNEVEIAYLGLFMFTVSVFWLTHAITTPGVLFTENHASDAAAFWAVPIAVIVGFPALLMRSTLGRGLDADWRKWVTTAQYLVVAIAALVLIVPSLIPAPAPGSLTTKVAIGLSVVGCATYSFRHCQLAIIARSNSPLIIALGYGLIGGSMLLWVGATSYSYAFWISHLFTMFGTLGASLAGLTVYRRTDHVRPMIEPIIAVDPRCALEVGMDPSVHQFISDLDSKDPITAEHIVRTTSLAMTIGPKLGLDRVELRDLGLTAMFHDIGMLLIPDSIVGSPTELDEREYAIVKRHSDYGAEIVENSPALKSIAPAVRAHHERLDGSGYPAGLTGPAIPLNARIVAACDAFDALSNTRQYRPRVDREAALEILERFAGSQWDRRVVEVLARTVRNNPPRDMPERMDALGRIGCDCIPHVDAA